MMRRQPLLSGIALALAVAPALAVQAPPPSVQPLPQPRYEVEPCCDLCPLAANPAVYNTKFLGSFRTLLQGTDGWLYRTEDDLRTSFGPDEDAMRDLRRFRDELHKHGTELVVMMQPPRGVMSAEHLPRSARGFYNVDAAKVGYSMMLQRLRGTGIVVPDLMKLMHERDDHDFFFRADHHWTPYGSRRAARIVAETIRAMPVYAGIPKKDFVTERTGVLAKKGTYQKAASQLCGFGYQEQYVDQYATAAKDDSDLFGTESVPQVVLVGTSNSDVAYNFSGFLSEFLSVDVLNEAVTGGGPDGALLEYLPSDEFQKSPPKIMVWELETYHNLSSKTLFRTLVPRVSNGCATKPAVLEKTVPLHVDTTEVLFNGGGQVKDLLGSRYQLDLQYNDPEIRELRGTVWYTNGSREQINLKFSELVDAKGHFTFELRHDGDWGDRNFMSLDLQTPEGAKPGLTAVVKLCARSDTAFAPTPPPPERKEH